MVRNNGAPNRTRFATFVCLTYLWTITILVRTAFYRFPVDGLYVIPQCLTRQDQKLFGNPQLETGKIQVENPSVSRHV